MSERVRHSGASPIACVTVRLPAPVNSRSQDTVLIEWGYDGALHGQHLSLESAEQLCKDLAYAIKKVRDA